MILDLHFVKVGDFPLYRLDCLRLIDTVDDMTAEQIGFAVERFFEGGALVVYTVPVGMKRSRPGTMICALCAALERE